MDLDEWKDQMMQMTSEFASLCVLHSQGEVEDATIEEMRMEMEVHLDFLTLQHTGTVH